MSIGENIEAALVELGWSQSELARRSGLPQSTINGLIRKGYRSSPHLPVVARTMGKSIEQIVGGDVSDSIAPPVLSSDETECVDLFRLLQPKDRAALLQIARTMAGAASPSRSVHAPRSTFKGRGE